MTRTKRYPAMGIPSLILVQLVACGSGVQPRAAALDPANPNGPESPPVSVSMAPPESPGAPSGQSAHADGSHVEGSDQHAKHGHTAASVDSAQARPPAAPDQAGSAEGSAIYACPMHPEVKSPEPGQCPKCGMKLVLKGKPRAADPASTPAASAAAPHSSSPKAVVYACPMHPEVTGSQPGKCPKCGMKLVPQKDGQ
jgi:DNA-directed RNA polymerase subunit RPC12/RpoP